jgi:hypothetical protein
MRVQELRRLIRETIIKELFDTKEKIKWKSDGSDDPDYSAVFTGPNNRKYEIVLQFLEYLSLPDDVYTEASRLFPKEDIYDEFFDYGYHVEFGDMSQGKGITGLGGTDTAKIFGIVINAVADKIKKAKIDYIFFSAKEDSRKALYKKMIPSIADKLGMSQVNNGKYFYLYKK